MNLERRGWLAVTVSLVLALLNLIGIWIASFLLVFTYSLAFHDFYLVYAMESETT